MKITGNTILVTGGTSGIGRALAEALHDRGNRVIVAGRRQALLDEVTAGRERHGRDAARPGRPGLAAAPRRRSSERAFPELNVLVANAGISSEEDMAGGWDVSAAEAMVETNILGTMRVTAALLPALKQQPDAAIMVTTSNLAFVPRAVFPTYCATKAFLHSWLQSLRHQLRNVPVEVLELAPPYVRTELTGQHQASDPRGMPLDAYVAEVMRLLESARSPRGEILVERARGARWAERERALRGRVSAMNPA